MNETEARELRRYEGGLDIDGMAVNVIASIEYHAPGKADVIVIIPGEAWLAERIMRTISEDYEAENPEDDEPDLPDFDPGPEVDDEGGMSEYRHAWTPDETETHYDDSSHEPIGSDHA